MRTKTSVVQSDPDMMMFFVLLVLVTIGLIMVYSSSSIITLLDERRVDAFFYLKRQSIFLVIGFTAMLVTTRIPYRFWRSMAYPMLAAAFVLLVAVLIPGFGARGGGAVRWLHIGSLTFQVAEFVKLAWVIFLAYFFTKKHDDKQGFLPFFILPLLLLILLSALILLQPDFGTIAIMGTVMFMMAYIAGGRLAHLAGILSFALPFAAAMVFYESYRLERLLAFLDPWKDPQGSGYQLIQSYVSFVSGGLFGVGLGNGMQKLYYLPEPHTDFILSVLAEEAGFLGVLTVIVLFIFLAVRGFMVAFRSADLFGSILAVGLIIVIMLEAFINMAGVMGLMPIKGLPLPFMSYGGTSLIVKMAMVGILLNISSYGTVKKSNRR